MGETRRLGPIRVIRAIRGFSGRSPEPPGEEKWKRLPAACPAWIRGKMPLPRGAMGSHLNIEYLGVEAGAVVKAVQVALGWRSLGPSRASSGNPRAQGERSPGRPSSSPASSDKGRALAGTIQLDRSCLLDLLPQILRPSLVTGLVPARASLTPRLAQASASQSLPSQLNRPGLVE